MQSKFTNPVDLENKINEFYQWCQENDKKITVERLAWYLGTNHRTIKNWIDSKDIDNKYTRDITKEDKIKCIEILEEAYSYILSEVVDLSFNKNSVVGSIFNLKNNFGYSDKQEIEIQQNQNPLENLSIDELEKLEQKIQQDLESE
jgi:hypothetical protein